MDSYNENIDVAEIQEFNDTFVEELVYYEDVPIEEVLIDGDVEDEVTGSGGTEGSGSREPENEDLEGIEDEGLDAEGQKLLQSTRKRRKRKDVDENDWIKPKNKKLREAGKDYKGLKEKKILCEDGVKSKWQFSEDRSKRTLKPRCKCSADSGKLCTKITDDDRANIHREFWELLSWDEKRLYVCNSVVKLVTSRHRDRIDEQKSRRENTFAYYICVGEESYRVCKTMFLNTYNVTDWAVRSWKLKAENHITPPKECKPRGVGTRNINARKSKLVDFFNKLVKLPSHLSRSDTTKLFLEPLWETKVELYRTYVRELSPDDVPVSQFVFDTVFESMNLSLYRRKKDLCDKCFGYEKKLIPEVQYQEHIQQKELARREKERDKKGPHRVFQFDKQAILLAPKNNASAMFYKSKVTVHNYCILDLKTRQGFSYLWHEGNGGLVANVFASMLIHFLSNAGLKKGETIILWSDGCSAQNKNQVLSNALLNFSILNDVTIIHKYLEVGHTQMEVDNMHSCIGSKVKLAEVNLPSDYIHIIKGTRLKLPYIVEYLDYSFFKNFEIIRYVNSIKPGRHATVNEIHYLKYTSDGKIQYKLKFGDDVMYEDILGGRTGKMNNITPVKESSLPKLYSKPLKISKNKYDDLQALKLTLCREFHPFYDNLSHS